MRLLKFAKAFIGVLCFFVPVSSFGKEMSKVWQPYQKNILKSSVRGTTSTELTMLFTHSKKQNKSQLLLAKGIDQSNYLAELCTKQLEFEVIPLHCYTWIRLNSNTAALQNRVDHTSAEKALDEVCAKRAKNINLVETIRKTLKNTSLSHTCVSHLIQRQKILDYISIRETPSKYFSNWMSLHK